MPQYNVYIKGLGHEAVFYKKAACKEEAQELAEDDFREAYDISFNEELEVDARRVYEIRNNRRNRKRNEKRSIRLLSRRRAKNFPAQHR